MEPVGWVSCGCGKGVSIYARKQETKKTVEKVVEQLGQAEPTITIDGMTLPLPEKSTLKKPAQRLCALCKQPFTGRKHLKYCTYDCYLESRDAKHAAKADLEPPTAVEAAWKTSPEETKELLEELES